MTRSDALLSLERVIKICLKNEYEFKVDEIAQILLTHCESTLGMLPPEKDVMIEGHQCSVNEWEDR